MVNACRALVADSGLAPVFVHTFSDEISLYLTGLPFSGRVEKIDSVAALSRGKYSYNRSRC